jgi:protein disulfide-isomerase A1
VFQTEVPLGHIIAKTSEERDRLSKMVESLAKEYKDKILFGTVDISSFDSLEDILHFEPDDPPAFAIKEPVKGHRYLLTQCQQLSEEVLATYVRDFIEGKLKPTIKSEPVPAAQHGPVIVIVGRSYEDLVINNENDVLLDYYTQSCIPCKAMAPIYEKLAKLYASNATGCDRVTIGKIDAEANDVSSDIRGFPTFKLYPAGRKESPVRYDGPWTIEGFANFVRDNGKHGVDVLLEDNATESNILQVEHPVAQTTCGKAISGTDAYKTGAVQGAASKEDDAPPIVLAEIRESARSDHGEL